MSTFYPKYDYNPNVTKEAVVGEPHTIPTTEPYEIYLKHIPRQESPSTVSISGADTAWVEVADPPTASGQFRVDYGGGQGRIIFHGSDAGKSVTVNYNACGTVVWAETYPDGREGVNKIQETIEAHTSRTDNPHAVTAAQVGAVSKAGDTMTGALIADRDVGPGDTRVYKHLASYKNATSGLTGTLKIALPKSWSNTMLRIRIVGYDYSSNSAWEVTVAGYNYAATPAWLNYSAELRGMAPFNSVRLGHDGTVNCILLGTTTSTWQYPYVVVDELIASQASVTGWESGWQIALITSETGIGYIVTPALRTFWHAGNDGTGSGLDADLFDGMDSSQFVRRAQAGAVLVHSNATGQTTTSTSYWKVKESRIGKGGTYRIAFGLRTDNSSVAAFGRIYRNGVAVGTERSTTSTTLVTFTEDVSGWSPNDLVQIYARSAGGASAIVGNLELRVVEADVYTAIL